jgi:hypothetical protein
MAKKSPKVNADRLAPADSEADWGAQGWATEAEPVSPVPRLEAAISVRFDPNGAHLLRRAARMKGLTKSQFVRQATLQVARKVIEDTPLPASMWMPRWENLASTAGSGQTIVSDPAPRSMTTTTTRLARALVVE